MLQFIYGRAATGKTYTVLERIKTDIENGKSVVLLVPEQFTFESERTLLHTLGDKSSTNVSVLSFTRLYDEVCRKVGGRVADLITEFDRVLLIYRALSAVSDNLKLWGRYKNSPKFAETLAATITELKTSAILPEDLSSAAERIEEDYLKNKLNDLAFVYGAYNAMLGSQFLDPNDSMSRLADNLLKYKYFENKTVYIDAFKNFTGQQYKIIERILSQADDVVCSFTADEIYSTKTDIFYNVRTTVSKVKRLAEKLKCEITEPLELTTAHYANEELCAVEKALLNKPLDADTNETEFVTLCRCATAYDEAMFAAQTIRRLVRENGYRYKDFVIISRDAEKYQKDVLRACEENGVFCFSDKRKPITYLPLTVFIQALLSLSVSYSTDNILTLLKTGLTSVSTEELFTVSNYIYLWNITGPAWRDTWQMNPKSFGAIEEKYAAEATEQLNIINGIREKTVGVINEFLEDFRGTPSQMVKAVLACLRKCEVADKLKLLADEMTNDGLLEAADDIRQSWDIIMQIFDGIVKCMPDKEITSREFIDAWRLAASYATIGNIPQMLDEVTFGSADRIKPSRPKIAFILGLNQGEFPKTIKSSGVFASSEREKLIENGLELASTAFTSIIDEDYLAYTSLCCPRERLYISYSMYDGSAKKQEPSIIVNTIQSAFPALKILQYPSESIAEFPPETTRTAVSRMCGEYSRNRSAAATIDAALKGTNGTSIEDYIKSADKTVSFINSDTAQKLFGRHINISATQFDRFHRCRFMYFCKHGLGLNKIQPANFDVLQRGTIVHYVLQRIIEEYNDEFAAFTKEQTDALVDGYLRDYLAAIPGYEGLQTERMKFLVGKISLIVKDVAYHIVREFAQSDFKPRYCELQIGKNKTIESEPIDVGKGTFSIIGSIDRVDTWNGYVRVVDYKTGTKIFKLSDILLGLDMQMLIYLYSIIRSKDENFSSLLPAGVLYMPSKRDKEDTCLTMNGIVLEDEDVVRAMDKENLGEFIPKMEYTQKGVFKTDSFVSAETFESIFKYIDKLLVSMGESLYSGDVAASPTDGHGKSACDYCDFYSICCIEDKPHKKAVNMKNIDVLLKLKEEVE